jgi:serralysin
MASRKIKQPSPGGNIISDDGSHRLVGTGKADLLYLQKSADASVSGAGGSDTLVLNSTRAVKVDLSAIGPQKTSYGTLTLKSVESVITGRGNDTLLGNKAANLLMSGKGNDLLRGGNGHDFLMGDAGKDKLYGDSGNDFLFGDAGKDILTGGKGRDGFAEKASRANMDRITDFSVRDDTIYLTAKFFPQAGKAGALTAEAFHIGAAAEAADDRIVYNSDSGALFYDADGNGGGAAVQFATIGRGLALTNRDFEII